jgi:hypothetical protein
LIFLQEINAVFKELSKRYKEEAKAETLRVFEKCKRSYESQMRAALDGNEHNYFEGQSGNLHLAKKKTCLDEFKNNAAPDFIKSYLSQLEQVFFLINIMFAHKN